MRIYDVAQINEERFAILVDDETKEAYDAVWNGQRWETDFSHHALKTTADEVAEALEYDRARKEGYRFPDDPKQE